MCGIVGYIGKDKCQEVLINGLKELEYRGYDSAGLAYVFNDELIITKKKGKIIELEKVLEKHYSNLGIGHTRWATHGIPSEINSHPHKSGKITIVHNGIIENYASIKEELIKEGVTFKSETDTEVAAALLNNLYSKTNDMLETMKLFEKKVRGAYALGIINDDDFNTLYAIKKASPLIVGIGKNEKFIASDVPAILKYTNKYTTLNDGDMAIIKTNSINYYDINGKRIDKEIKTFEKELGDSDKHGYEHFMLKEIHEQPEVIKNTISPFLEDGIHSLLDKMPDFSKYNKIIIVACGSAMHAGLIGKNEIEELANIPVEVEIASEFRYKKLFIDENSLVIAISQSGETADTLAAVKIAKEMKATTLGIINRVDSTIARNTDYVFYTKAGIEKAVATTKAYSAQIAILSLIALNIAIRNKLINDIETNNIIESIKTLPTKIESLLTEEKIKEIKNIANKLYQKEDMYFIGRNIDYALCMEGALKLKEISYIHSEAYAAGELKHGTISLIEEETPVISVITDEKIAEKTVSNIKEVKSRGANTILVTNEENNNNYDCIDNKIIIPATHKLFEPILAVIPLQILAYEVAKLRGCDIDQPKNLAKSVTVE
mgnify:FL=1